MSRTTAFVWNDTTPRPAAQQMAIDRAHADRAARDGTIVYRLYRWAGDSVSFGANEAATRTWDRERLERLKVHCVRRPTGGRGVWHDATDLTYSITAPLAEFGDLRTAYRVIHEQLARALGHLDVAASVAPNRGRPTLSPGGCFDLTIGGEVMVAGRKTIGSAQALIGAAAALLQHGAIARADRAPRLARFRLERTVLEPDISRSPLPSPDLVAKSIVDTWIDAGGAVVPNGFVEQSLGESAAYAASFQDPEWTWRR